MPEDFLTVTTELPRDGYGRPLITPPNGGKPIPYQRVTTFVGALEDTYHLSLWSQRMVALGVGTRRDLALAVSAITDPKNYSQKKTLNQIVRQAKDAGVAVGGADAAITGTALHSFTEVIDRGETPRNVPEEYVADLEAYTRVMKPFGIVAIEGFCVLDDLQVGGSYDRILSLPEGGLTTPDGDTLTGNVVGDLKGLTLDTRIPTPSGWTTMGKVAVGDKVFGSDGRPCTVTAKSDVKNIGTYVVKFDDGSQVVCDSEHIWWTSAGDRPGEPTAKPIGEIIDTLHHRGQSHHRVPVAGVLDLPEADLPIDPYLLGCWIGDGSVRSGQITKGDDLFEVLASDGHEFGVTQACHSTECITRTVVGLTTRLREEGLQHNKHIPTQYLRASQEQRTLLLQGLMDTDGTWNTARKEADFTTTDKKLALQVEELALSLGQRVYLSSNLAKGFGLEVTAYHVKFTPVDMNPFRLPRKADQASASGKSTTKARRRVITSVESGPDLPTACIAVDSPNRTYLCGEKMIPTHNTGAQVDLGMGKIAMQLGCYANAQDYNHGIGTRTELPGSPSRKWAVVIHLPAGTGRAELLWVDIAAGWQAASTIAPAVHAWRKRKDLHHVFAAEAVTQQSVSLPELVRSAESEESLRVLWSEHATVWTSGLTELAKTRIEELRA